MMEFYEGMNQEFMEERAMIIAQRDELLALVKRVHAIADRKLPPQTVSDLGDAIAKCEVQS